MHLALAPFTPTPSKLAAEGNEGNDLRIDPLAQARTRGSATFVTFGAA